MAITKQDLQTLLNQNNSLENSVIEQVKILYRQVNMIEHIEEPTDQELVQAMKSAIMGLNMVDPATPDRTYNQWIEKFDSEQLLVQATLCETIKIIISDYTHRSISDHSIEDIQVKDRKSDYETLQQLCNEDLLRERVKTYKQANKLGIGTEEGVAMGTIRKVHLNDFDGISLTRNSSADGTKIFTSVNWGNRK